jgi:tRNA threonylcarbamoyladenosine modification (KEOPS) complex Cgi121 subunit
LRLSAYVKAYMCPAGMQPEEVKLELLKSNPGAVVQTAKPDVVKNEFFYEMLAAQTLLAEASGSLLAKKPEVDLLLRLAGTTQISRAISEFGSKAGDPFLVVVAGRRGIASPEYLAPFEMKRTGLSKKEIDRVEMAALLDVERA